jgi:hypothetical protein
MTDRIYVTYTPTTAPGTYHTTIHYERTDSTGNVVKHVTIEGQPENLDELGASDKATGVVEETFRKDDGPSRFGRIDAHVQEQKSSYDPDPNASYEILAEGDDLSANLARMQLFAQGVNRAGFAYRGQRQNSNSFASAALQAGELPPATGVAHDPAGPPGELSQFFAPGLNEPLRAPIGPSREAADVARRSFDNRFGKWDSVPTGVTQPSASDRPESFDDRFRNWGSVPAGASGDSGSPVLRALEQYRRSAAPDGPASTSTRGALPATPADVAGTGGVLGKFMGNRVITSAAAASPSGPMLSGPAAANSPSEESALGTRPKNAPGAPRPDTYPQLQRVSSAFPGMTPPNPEQPMPLPEADRPLGIFTGKPMPQWATPVPLGGLLGNSKASGDSDWFNLLAGLVSRNSTPPEPPQQTADSIPERRLGQSTYSVSPAAVFDTGPAVPFVSSGDANYSGGLLGMFAALAGSDPNQPVSPGDEQEQADLQTLEDRLSSSGNINDAWALYKARIAGRR